jgi:hypothetical protein
MRSGHTGWVEGWRAEQQRQQTNAWSPGQKILNDTGARVPEHTFHRPVPIMAASCGPTTARSTSRPLPPAGAGRTCTCECRIGGIGSRRCGSTRQTSPGARRRPGRRRTRTVAAPAPVPVRVLRAFAWCAFRRCVGTCTDVQHTRSVDSNRPKHSVRLRLRRSSGDREDCVAVGRRVNRWGEVSVSRSDHPGGA